ncbi:hypothetical protein [Mesorhizobium sp. WSM3224]|nr:hypothetical protein [Mesorhizobium sp. WSM3224]
MTKVAEVFRSRDSLRAGDALSPGGATPGSGQTAVLDRDQKRSR